MTTAISEIPIKDISPNPNNPRRKLEGIKELAASIDLIGLIEPIVVRVLPETNKWVVVAGHRRLAAMQSLGRTEVTCVISERLAPGEAMAALSENTARHDLPAADLADALGRLAGLDMTDDEIARALSVTTTAVANAQRVAGADAKVRAKIAKAVRKDHQLSLDEQAALVEFADDVDATREIFRTINFSPRQLAHTLAELRADRARAEKIKALRESMGDARQIEEPGWYEGPSVGTEPLANLTDGAGKGITAAKHAECPGRALCLEHVSEWEDEEPRVTEYCTDWKGNGHKMKAKPPVKWTGRRTGTGSMPTKPNESPAAAKKATEQRRAVIANNKAWKPATEVRAEWLSTFMKRKTLTPAAKLWVLSEIAAGHDTIGNGRAGLKANATLDAAFIVVFGQLVDYREDEFTRVRWRPGSYNQPMLARYLNMLAGQGYALSDVEKLVTAKAKAR